MATVKWDPVVNVVMPFCVCLFLPFGNPLGNSYKAPDWSSMLTISGLAVVGLLLCLDQIGMPDRTSCHVPHSFSMQNGFHLDIFCLAEKLF